MASFLSVLEELCGSSQVERRHLWGPLIQFVSSEKGEVRVRSFRKNI